MRFPSLKEVAEVLHEISWNAELEEVPEDGEESEVYTEVRLQVSDDGSWRVWHSSPDYDTDHRGYWGAGVVWPLAVKKHCMDVARGLRAEAEDQYAQRQP